MKKTQKGFTLVELLVVIAILAILATVSVVGYTSFIDRAHQSNATTEADQIKSIIENSLLADDYVIVSDAESNVIYAKKVSGKVVFLNAAPTMAAGETKFDATDDIEALTGGTVKLTGTGTEADPYVLVYNNHDYDVKVMERVATPES